MLGIRRSQIVLTFTLICFGNDFFALSHKRRLITYETSFHAPMSWSRNLSALSWANPFRANLSGAYLGTANLTKANRTHANLLKAHLRQTFRRRKF
jgi:Pentapeptide repeats (8 copies)